MYVQQCPVSTSGAHATRSVLQIAVEQSPSRLLQVRGKMYELLVNCIPADVIFKTLLKELIPKVSEGLAHELTHWAAHYEHTLVQGSKEVFHLEAFVAKCKSRRTAVSV